jgi:hypothetical protein
LAREVEKLIELIKVKRLPVLPSEQMQAGAAGDGSGYKKKDHLIFR